MDKVKLGTADLTQENVEKVAALFPDAVTEVVGEDGEVRRAIDFDALRDDLSADIVDGPRERYQFTWPGKRAAKLEARTPCDKTLRPCQDKSVDWDTTQNLYIEGDNLEALKLLRETYAGEVKLIYIDPPYNTGHDFIYDDDFARTRADYEAESGDFDEERGRLVANPESNGRFHSDWCSMMYPRLLLLRDLLAHDGLIAVSINDAELLNLGRLMDEIFGVGNRLAFAPWRSEPSGGKDKTALRTGHEYILFYAKTSDASLAYEEKSTGEMAYSDEKGPYAKGRELRKWGATSDRADRPNLWFGIKAPDGSIAYPIKNDGSEGYWRWSAAKEEMKALLANPDEAIWEMCPYDTGVVVDGRTERLVPYEKVRDEVKLFGWNSWLDNRGTNSDATAELKNLFNGKKPFDTPKPTKLLKWLVGLYKPSEDTVILDIFSGAASTADAVMQTNAEDGISRKFIMVQLPEECPDGSVAAAMGFSTICDVGEERIRRAGKKIFDDVKAVNEAAEGQLSLDGAPAQKLLPDVGFRVFRIDSSNFVDTRMTPGALNQGSLDMYIDNVKPGRSAEDLLFQVLPVFRIPLSASIEIFNAAGAACFDVNSGQLIACFDINVSTEAIEVVAQKKPLYAVFRDASLADDATAANFEELFRTYSPDTIRRVI